MISVASVSPELRRFTWTMIKKKEKNNNFNGALILRVTIATNNNKKSAYFVALELEILLHSSV